MAERRMFSKSITNSSVFLKMPMSSRLLWYDLGMNADDDGFVEHFMVLKMTGASEQDLGVLELNGLIKILDDNVIWIRDWKENNYIRNDRYKPSKYLTIYNLDTIGIPNGYQMDTQVRLGKDRLGKDRDRKEIELSKDNNIICSEPFQENDLEQEEIFIKIILNDKTFYSVLKHDVDTWKDLYPNVDVEQELRNMVGWCDSHPSNRKTRKGIKAFINNWLSKSQNQRPKFKQENKVDNSNVAEDNDPYELVTPEEVALVNEICGR